MKNTPAVMMPLTVGEARALYGVLTAITEDFGARVSDVVTDGDLALIRELAPRLREEIPAKRRPRE